MVSPPGSTGESSLRADAARNRERIAEAARSAFAELGADAPIAEIARRAGVGSATLYRRFPTRDDLLELVFADQIVRCADEVEGLVDRADPWEAFAEYLTFLFELQREDRAFTTALLRSFPEGGRLAREHRRADDGLELLVDRARAAGVLRADFAGVDVVMLLQAHEGVIAGFDAADRDGAEAASARVAAILLDGCRPRGART
ncbi:TetR/AcrR family transcriptional regulator [Aeromicrobium sp. CFBP 8757]|uniref:TetR/AcrR family transcriptional regulator n=1 Tax=Aeromicrobium sp. CFBP 8757 TaxID=2775288 RepID=UPI0017833C82|nr:TetR/AcrR family transcriptional regulator [Aeromicrobium sp. CFBP 8757]MBD8605505.1 TetR/AcrR family transcriptional regulator [Aeromicrobium sp. CFBP 8757]